MVSVIIPAHNEQAVIGRCLRRLLEGAQPGELEVIVVANGCSDKTADEARAAGPAVRVVDTPVASKSNALNLGTEAATGFPRIYVDADVVLDIQAIRAVATAVGQPGILAAAPAMRVDCTDRPWTIRAYYDVWLRLPYCRRGMIGSGVYGLSEAGAQRLGQFPAITADDAYARLSFAPGERLTIESCTFTITPPRTLGRLIDIKIRSHFGNVELRQHFPNLWRNETGGHWPALLTMAANPLRWFGLAVYVYVKLSTRLGVRRRLQRNEIHKWERDDSSRQPLHSATQADEPRHV